MPLLLTATSQHLQWCLQVHKCWKECTKTPPASHIEHYCISTHRTQQRLFLNAHSVQALSQGCSQTRPWPKEPQDLCVTTKLGKSCSDPASATKGAGESGGQGAWRPIQPWQNLFPPQPVTPRKQEKQRVMKAPSSQKGQGSNPAGCFLICAWSLIYTKSPQPLEALLQESHWAHQQRC